MTSNAARLTGMNLISIVLFGVGLAKALPRPRVIYGDTTSGARHTSLLAAKLLSSALASFIRCLDAMIQRRVIATH